MHSPLQLPSGKYVAPVILFFFLLIVGIGVLLVLLQEEPTEPESAVTDFIEIPITRENIPALTEQANEFYERGEYEKTVTLYREILKIDPLNDGLYAELAHTLRYWHKFEEAEVAFLKAIELNPHKEFYYTDLAKLYRNMHNFEKADWALKESLKIDPNNATTYSYGLGYLYFEFQRFEEAEAAFLKAQSIDPNLEIAYSGLGDVYRETGRFEEAEAMYKKAFEINPQSESYLGLGWLYMYQERYEDAEVPFKAFLTNIREKAEVYYALSQAYKGSGKLTEAKEALERAVSLTPDDQLIRDAFTQFQNEHPELF